MLAKLSFLSFTKLGGEKAAKTKRLKNNEMSHIKSRSNN